mmetsp:Transcript_12524/g.31941  ORF Transcript_12524/g.31941 Transcript_12524/m.31941 type:complete len:145 (+) Transcript_12524:561-995(+)
MAEGSSERETLQVICSATCESGEDRDARELAASMKCFFLCGNCGSLSKLHNGKAVLDTAEDRADREGRLRIAKAKQEELEKRVEYLNRRWTQTKQGYSALAEATQKLEAAECTVRAIEVTLAPVQLWCSACGWEWPEDRPTCVK